MYNETQRAKAAISFSHTMANIFLQKSIVAETKGDMVEAEKCMEEYFLHFDQLLEKSLTQKEQALIIFQAFLPPVLQPMPSNWQVPPESLVAADPMMPTVNIRKRNYVMPVAVWNAARAKNM